MLAQLLLPTGILLSVCHGATIPAVSYYYFMPSTEAIPPTPLPPPHRTVYYPLRINCQARCIPQTRYRWVLRPSGPINKSLPPVPPPLPSLPSNVNKPSIPQPQPAQPSTSTTTPAASSSSKNAPRLVITIRPEPKQLRPSTLPPPPPTMVYIRPQQPAVVAQRPYDRVEQSVPAAPTPTTPSNKRQNPCPDGKPLLNEYKTPVTCNFVVQPNGGCPNNYWCHTGSSFETTTCCPIYNLKERCHLPRSNGDGDDLIPRWYYDITLRKCKRFLYKGMRGNANNFITSIQCMETCETTERAAASKNSCASGPPGRDNNGELFRCGPKEYRRHSYYYGISAEQPGMADDDADPAAEMGRCPAGYYCHVGESVETTACCEVSSGIGFPDQFLVKLVRDRCLLEWSEGEGTAALPRFYYNASAMRCLPFVYRGARGNENNFLTLGACRRSCMKYSNPCPILFDYGELKACVADEASGAPRCPGKNEWCHVGSSLEKTACCPGAVADPCKQPMDVGQGAENLTRWYADPDDESCERQCLPFVYRGAKGNQNNFVSRELCDAACKHCFNPCSSGELLIEPDSGRPMRCDADSGGSSTSCPAGYWCHLGASAETTVCCTAVKRACQLPVVEGVGQAELQRWYYDKNHRRCQRFIYRGIGGNQNSYVTRHECEHACPPPLPSPPDSAESPCGGGALPLMVGSLPKVCSPDHRCPSTHFCHIGAPETPNYCCPKNGDPCEHSMSVGHGPYAIRRFYYDEESHRCREFVYKGARGNANNFLSMDDCELVCQVPPVRNPCRDGQPLVDDTNEPLICGGDEQMCPAGYWCHVGGSPQTTNCCPGNAAKPCDQPVDVGQGSERLERWYFDARAQTCREFYYGGLRGNANNFLTLDACREACPGLNPCLIGEPLLDRVSQEPVTCRADEPLDSCPARHYCHASTTLVAESVCCPRTAVDVDPCNLPLNSGVGAEPIRRWHYDVATARCEAFNYGGARGNENNFISRTLCELNCPVKHSDRGKQHRRRHYCPHGEPKMDRNTGRPMTCGAHTPCSVGYVCHVSSADHSIAVCCEDPATFCLHARDEGPCEAEEQRYGYNPVTDTCVPYRYGGCGGTLNNFLTLQRCTEICCREYRQARMLLMLDDDKSLMLNGGGGNETESIDFYLASVNETLT